MSGDTSPKAADVARAAVRHKTFERTTVTVAGATSTAHILNLSATGALLHSDISVIRSVHIFVDIGGRPVSGEVMWVDKARFGVRFDRHLAQDLIATLLRQSLVSNLHGRGLAWAVMPMSGRSPGPRDARSAAPVRSERSRAHSGTAISGR